MFQFPNVDECQVWKAVKVVNGSSKQNHISSDILCNDMNKFFATTGDKLDESFPTKMMHLY